MAILKNDLGLIQLHKCPKCNYLVQWNDTVNEEHLCKWCAAEQPLAPDVAITCANCGEYHSIYLPCKGGKQDRPAGKA